VLQLRDRAVGSAVENLKNLQGRTGPVGENGPQIVASLESSVDNLSELLGEIALLAKNLNNKDGTIGKLIHDDALYNELAGVVGKASETMVTVKQTVARTTQTIDQATGAVADIRKLINDPLISRRIQMILDNVWVFTDKIARDPARVARGIVPRNRETPLK